MHEVFSAIRLWQLHLLMDLPEHAAYNAARLFPPDPITKQDRWAEALEEALNNSDDHRSSLMSLCYAILHSSGYYDEPDDQIRTMSNMEVATIHYIDQLLPYFDNWPIYVSDEADPTKLVGVEQVFDVVLHFADGKRIRFIGTIDGCCVSQRHGRPYLDENKTAVRLDDGWRRSFEIAHQVTGYCAASTAVFGFPVLDARIHGLKLKITNRGDDYVTMEVQRNSDFISHWGQWVRWTVEQDELIDGDWERAPRFTHSCNRYFRACVLIPFCGDTPEGRRDQWNDMVPIEPSPSEKAVMEQV